MSAGKGDWTRPHDREKYRRNYDAIFGSGNGEDMVNEARGATCRDPTPRAPYTGRCIREAGHEGNHTDGETQWRDRA